MRDGPKILDQLIASHSDPRVGERDRVTGIVGIDRDGQGAVRLENLGSRSLQKPEFFRGVRRVRDKLADEDLLIRVKRMDDDIEELGDLRLKVVLFNGAHFVC